jgi:seryl-tRNA synthetase
MKNTLTLITLLFGLLLCPALAKAQTQSLPPSQMDPTATRERPLSEMEEELKAKQAIKFAEKGHQETLSRAKEIADIGKELKTAVKDTPLVSRDSEKKIERLEKLTRKIRGDAGGDDQEVELSDRPSDVRTALCRLAEAAETLSKDVKNTPRQVVSASVIEHANVLLELIKIVQNLSGKQ